MKFILTSILILFLINTGNAQVLKGIVFEKTGSDNLVPLIGTNIFWLGTQTGTTSNEEGYFELSRVNSADNLVISYIGYEPDTIFIPADQESIEITLSVNRELNEVIVTGTSFSKYISEFETLQTEILTSKELLKAACCNLSESFTTNNSVDVQFQDAVTGAKQIQLLGLAGIYTQTTIENIPNLRGVFNSFSLGYVPGPWMTSISISKGAASVVNGYESITGQINIEYKKPDDIEKFYFNAYQSSHFKTDLNANASMQVSDNLSTIILAHSDFNIKSVDDNKDLFSDQPEVRQFNFVNKWQYFSEDGFESQFGVQVFDEQRRGGQILESHSGSTLHNGSNHKYEIDIDTKRYEVFTKNGYVFSSEPYTSLGLILNTQIHKQNSLFGLRTYNADQKSFFSNLIFETGSEDDVHKIKVGGSYIFDQYDEQFDSLNFYRKESRPGLFAEYNFSPSYDISIVPGARVDFHNLYGTFFTPRIHVKYNLDDNTTLRLSAGKGYRSQNLIADNINYLATSRRFVVLDQPSYEEGWNYGFNVTRYLTINDRDLRITADFYRTDFIKQTVVDIDSDVREIRFYDLNGSSYSNNYQVELAYELINRLDASAAFRYSDVNTMYMDKMMTKPLVSRYKALITLSYATEDYDWFFDSSFLINGDGRIPDTKQNPAEYQRAESFPSYVNINAQITKKIDIVDLYFGVENLTNFKQTNPIIAADNPFGEYFDSSLVWGPIEGRKLYVGVRLSVL